MDRVGDNQRRLLATLSGHAVEFVVIGGVAAQVHGWDGATLDLDITVAGDPDNRRRLDAALTRLKARLSSVGPTGSTFETSYGRLEILSRTDGPADYAAWARRATEQILAEGLVIAIAHPDDVLLSKESAGRAKDLDALPSLRRAFVDRGLIELDDVRGSVADAAADPAPGPSAELIEKLGPPFGPADPAGMAMWQTVAAELERSRTDLRYQGDSPAARALRTKLAKDAKRVRGLRRRT